jgi:hypothetical protein
MTPDIAKCALGVGTKKISLYGELLRQRLYFLASLEAHCGQIMKLSAVTGDPELSEVLMCTTAKSRP